jgi:hypothetical protein
VITCHEVDGCDEVARKLAHEVLLLLPLLLVLVLRLLPLLLPLLLVLLLVLLVLLELLLLMMMIPPAGPHLYCKVCQQPTAVPQFCFSPKSLLLLLPRPAVLLNHHRLRPEP